MSHVTRVFKTVGPLEGKTVNLAGHQFTDGVFVFSGPETDAAGIGKYLNSCWEVVDATAESGEALVPKVPTPPEEQPNKLQALGNERLATALGQLDPENDEHWTKIGKPAMAALEQFYGSTDFTRADVEAAIPDFDREAARAAKQQ